MKFGISSEHVHHILDEYLGMTKLAARWMSRLLTIDFKFHLPSAFTTAKLLELRYEIVPHPSYPDLATSEDYFFYFKI